MGIRYYAYAFKADQAEQATADPASALSDDPFADAWGLEPGVDAGPATGVQRLSESDMLYLDKAWRHLQRVTAPVSGEPKRPAHRMFEGEPGWYGRPVERTLAPETMPEIAADLALLIDEDVADHVRSKPCFGDPDGEVDYVLDYLARAREFVAGLVETGRGMVYLIG
ncbi:hypothetical protein [Gordonia phthalatica]|uniref:DUF1877 domain-containing protein n=1 Tax=Gordonia phthalatica TaxID=1136941 RepID=A0A0N9NCP9_9ACTN|nr:hypothetical protein [Gordonia phthalatica]ALG85442.1 hypothetical protein ACH46_14365 [Gordonia phthalatica]